MFGKGWSENLKDFKKKKLKRNLIPKYYTKKILVFFV